MIFSRVEQPILPFMEDRKGQDDVRKCVLDLVRSVNKVVGQIDDRVSSDEAAAEVVRLDFESRISYIESWILNTTYVYASGDGYLQLSDGTMELWGTDGPFNCDTGNITDSRWWTNDAYVAFAYPFIAAPLMYVSADSHGFASVTAGPTLLDFSYSVVQEDDTMPCTGCWRAIGRWK